MARRGRTRRPTAGMAEASAAAPPLAMTVLLAVSLAAAAIEIDSLSLVTGSSLSASPAWLRLSGRPLWLLGLLASWSLFGTLERHLGRRLATDQLERRWAHDLSPIGVSGALDDVQDLLRRFGDGARRLQNAPALFAWVMLLSWRAGEHEGALAFLLAANGAALIFGGFARPWGTSGPMIETRSALIRTRPKVNDLRAVGAEGAAFHHLWANCRPDLLTLSRERRLWRDMLRMAATSMGVVACLAAADVSPTLARDGGLLLLCVRMLLCAKGAGRARSEELAGGLERRSEMPPAPSPTCTSSPAILNVSGLDVIDDRGEVRGPVSFRAAVGGLTWLVAPEERDGRALIELLLGLRRAEQGLVQLGGDQADRTDGRRWRARCGFVPSQPPLVRGSLRDNLLVCAPQTSNEALVTGVIAASPDGSSCRLLDMLETRVGPAYRLTAGELRTISFARALMRRPELMIVESEPEGLSAAEARHFERLVRALTSRCIVVAVTASLSPNVRPADTAIMLDRG